MLKKLFDSGRKELKRCEKIATKVLALDESMQKLSDDELKNKTTEFKERLAKGETLDDLLVEAYAVCREAAYRVTGMKAYPVQLAGAIAIHGGNIAEMKTGEGKTLTAVFPAYLNALSGKGVHIVTVNEYLAQRETDGEIGDIYRFLGLTVGLNLRDYDRTQKQEAYQCDILYSTNSELGFDYLRDHMVQFKSQMVQRELNYAIIDEVDSILIDEARTPLIISGGATDKSMAYIQADTFAKRLKDEDYELDVESKTIVLTPSGIAKAEKFFGVDNLYDIKYVTLVHHINNALKANYIFHNGVEYVVQNGEVLIVDSFTGRILKGRQYSEGLHQAIEAKENVEIKKETVTVATITYQNYFRMYKKLSGMTGTAKTEEEEFRDIYNMYVVEVPTNKPVIRIDKPDLLFLNKKAKFNALIADIKERHAKGQPILVGTADVETSELVSQMLTKIGLPHEVLNAKNNAREAEIVALAGQKGQITISTNMAGRGTDIKLGEGVKELGGLAVLGTERHESRRIDNQLRGRSGRQGDPGFSQFCVSFEDDLMVRFGTDRAKEILARVGFSGEQSIRNKMLSKSIETAQRRVEGNNFDIRKTLLKYDDVINQQRLIIYSRRNDILDHESIHEETLETFKNTISDLVEDHLVNEKHLSDRDIDEILETVNESFLKNDMKKEALEGMDTDEIISYIYARVVAEYEEKMSQIPEEVRNEFEKAITLRVIDTHWMEHINTMSHLREGIYLRSYAQMDPLQAYTKEGYQLFDEMTYTIDRQTTIYLLRAEIRQNVERKQVAKGEAVEDSTKTKKRTPKKTKKVGRNDPCPCGSGKKYKNCCGK